MNTTTHQTLKMLMLFMIIDLKNEVICLNFVSEKNEASREEILQFLRYRVAPYYIITD